MVADFVAVLVLVAEDVDVDVLVGVPVDVLDLVPVDVPVPVELAVPVLVGVELKLAVAEAEPVFVPDVVIVADELLVPVAVELPVLVLVGVVVLVAVEVDVAEPVEVLVGEAVPVAVDVADPVVVEVAEAEPEDELDAMATPTCPPSTCQRYVVAVSETEISDSISPASANVADVSRAVFNPSAAPTTMSPPSAYIRSTKRMPAFVGGARVRVSVVVDVISQIWRSLVTVIVPPFPGSAINFGPRYRS